MADLVAAGGAEPQAISLPAIAPASIAAAHAARVESALASPGALWPLLATRVAAVVVQSASLDAFFYEERPPASVRSRERADEQSVVHHARGPRHAGPQGGAVGDVAPCVARRRSATFSDSTSETGSGA